MLTGQVQCHGHALLHNTFVTNAINYDHVIRPFDYNFHVKQFSLPSLSHRMEFTDNIHIVLGHLDNI